MASNHIKMYLQ